MFSSLKTKNIIQVPSPNFNDRKLDIEYVVIHSIALENTKAAIDLLQDSTSQVSAHYVIDRDGGIIQMVCEHQRAWHAGLSFWRGIKDMNSTSVGIELVQLPQPYFKDGFTDHASHPPVTARQYQRVQEIPRIQNRIALPN